MVSGMLQGVALQAYSSLEERPLPSLVTPVTKLDVLQIGPPHELEQELLQNESKSGASTPKTPTPSPRPSPRKKRGNLSDIISDFIRKVKLGRGKYLEKFNMRQHQVLARHRASRYSFS